MINLSIIIPHYNSVNTLRRLLHSIPNYNDIEVIVVDDRSDLKFKKELKLLKEKTDLSNLFFFENKSNKKGAGACRNIGLENARGNWILFADADDYFLQGFYQEVKKYFNTEYDVVFFKPTSVDDETGQRTDRHILYADLINNYMIKNDKYSELRLKYEFVVPWSKLINASFIKKNGIKFDNVIASNDVMFSTKVGYFMKKFAASDHIIYCVTRNRGSLTTTLSQEIFESRLNVFIDYYTFLKNHLNDAEFKLLGLNARRQLVESIKFGFIPLFTAFIKLRKNRIPFFELKVLNPFWIIKRAINVIKKHNKLKKYYK